METEFQLPLTKKSFSRSATKQLYLWGGGGGFAPVVASSPGLLALVLQSRRRQCSCCIFMARETDIIFYVENQNTSTILSNLHAKKTQTHKLG
jgi:hypothetical protein